MPQPLAPSVQAQNLRRLRGLGLHLHLYRVRLNLLEIGLFTQEPSFAQGLGTFE